MSQSETCVSVWDWLCALRLEQYCDAFQDDGLLKLEECQSLSLEQLERLGVTLPGHQRRILASLHKTQPPHYHHHHHPPPQPDTHSPPPPPPPPSLVVVAEETVVGEQLGERAADGGPRLFQRDQRPVPLPPDRERPVPKERSEFPPVAGERQRPSAQERASCSLDRSGSEDGRGGEEVRTPRLPRGRQRARTEGEGGREEERVKPKPKPKPKLKPKPVPRGRTKHLSTPPVEPCADPALPPIPPRSTPNCPPQRFTPPAPGTTVPAPACSPPPPTNRSPPPPTSGSPPSPASGSPPSPASGSPPPPTCGSPLPPAVPSKGQGHAPAPDLPASRWPRPKTLALLCPLTPRGGDDESPPPSSRSSSSVTSSSSSTLPAELNANQSPPPLPPKASTGHRVSQKSWHQERVQHRSPHIHR
ncbi:hypothetical protein NHX12_009245 [Muraenolepis orangiensis]|uniref:SAM domain-containing protein n=1 Tax=Muraenolepis orangiensis TaxID=630683 RepID=A0A9Q0DMY7_9TELE|nr:hypothetical protein NHX12_009245 [Muraenolepis orangiensis]